MLLFLKSSNLPKTQIRFLKTQVKPRFRLPDPSLSKMCIGNVILLTIRFAMKVQIYCAWAKIRREFGKDFCQSLNMFQNTYWIFNFTEKQCFKISYLFIQELWLDFVSVFTCVFVFVFGTLTKLRTTAIVILATETYLKWKWCHDQILNRKIVTTVDFIYSIPHNKTS